MKSPGLPLHSRELAAATVSPRGEKMLKAATRSMAATALEILTDSKLLRAVREDFARTQELIATPRGIPPGPERGMRG